jgi:hypothetical protein
MELSDTAEVKAQALSGPDLKELKDGIGKL